MRRHLPGRPQRGTVRLGAWLLGASWLFIAAMTLVPDPTLEEVAASTPWWCLVCGDLGAIDVANNVLLFVPLGVATYLLGWPLRRTVAIALTTTLLVESLQWSVLAGRDPSLSDLLTNTTGGVVGYLVAQQWRSWLLPNPTAAKRLQLAAIVAYGVSTLFTAYATGPAVSTRPLFGQWGPRFSHLSAFEGRIESAAVDGVSLPRGPYPQGNGGSWPPRTATGTISAELVSGPTPRRLAPIVALVDNQPITLLRLAQFGEDLVFSSATRSERLRLRGLSVRLENTFPRDGAATRVVVSGGRSTKALFVRSSGDGPPREASYSISPNWTWLLLYPFATAIGPGTVFLTGLWVSMWFVLIGYWGARAGAASRTVLSVVLVAIVGLGLVPLIAGLDPVPVMEWLGAGVGAGLGAALGRLSARPMWRHRNTSP